MILQSLFINGSYVGNGIYKHPPHRLNFSCTNGIYLCPHCGNVWAKLIYTDTDKPEKEFRYKAVHMPCALHDGGSLISGYNEAQNAALPRTKDFLIYELNLWDSKPDRYWFDGYSRKA